MCIQWTPHDRLAVDVFEAIDDDLQLFLWPSAFVLAAYIATSEDFRDKHVLELGAGVGLPSLVAGKIGALKVTITDRSEETTLRLIQDNIDLNSLGSVCSVVYRPYLITNLMSLPGELALGR